MSLEPFTTHTGVAVPLRRVSVDTDQVVPARFLKRTTRHGYEDALFATLREDPSFVLNDPAYAGASVLVAGADFGVGSSREQAVWALQDYGFRAVVAPVFGDIFRSNAGNAGLLTAVVAQDGVDELWSLLEDRPGRPVRVDLEQRTVTIEDGVWSAPFRIAEDVRRRLLAGLDQLETTLGRGAAVDRYERSRSTLRPTVPAAQ
jgi:3-isopropylmalate/(R)-2-methylmalate dehydratase small subunit